MSKTSQRGGGASLAIPTTLNLPTVTSHPSLKCLQWSADGQACFITKNSVMILTPDHGINFDTGSVTKSSPEKDDSAIGWFKTVIQYEKFTLIKWPEYSQAWSAVSLGSIDLSVVSVAISPFGLTSNAGSIFAILTSNMDLNLWVGGKNHLKGEWHNIFDVTQSLLNYFALIKDQHTTPPVLQAQTVCIDWTPQADFGCSPAPALDGSLLVLGNRAGEITFLRYCNGAEPSFVGHLRVSDKWITHIAFSCWDVIEPGCCEGHLAYGISDGSIGLVKVTQTLDEIRERFSFSPTFQIKVDFEANPVLIPGSTNAGISSMRWILPSNRSAILAASCPGLINLWSSNQSDSLFWTGSRSIRLRTQKTSFDSSSLHPVTGISYLHDYDKLIVTLFDGSFHVISNFSQDPCLVDDVIPEEDLEMSLSSKALSAVARTTFTKAEKGKVDKNDMVRIYGSTSYDGSAYFMWVYESTRPSDFSYKHDAQHNCMLVVAQMWEEEQENTLLQNLASLLNNVKSSSGLSPLRVLRPYFLHLGDQARLSRIRTNLLESLKLQRQEDHSRLIKLCPWTDDNFDSEMRTRFRSSLSSHLCGWDDLLKLRMRLSLADFAWKLSPDEQSQKECGVVAQGLLNAISHRILRTIMRHLLAVVKLLTTEDVPFVSRMIVQSLLPGFPSDLSDEGKFLSEAIKHLVGDDIVRKLNEFCPACGVEIPLQDITTAICSNGHTWPRCSITTFILWTPWVRSCVGCSRKAFLPPSEKKDLPAIAKGWVVEDLLEAVPRCLFCNNGFVRIL